MDDADRADRETERNLASALRLRRPAGPQATGACNFCGEFLPEALRWCDIDCREDWEKGARRAH